MGPNNRSLIVGCKTIDEFLSRQKGSFSLPGLFVPGPRNGVEVIDFIKGCVSS